jgi:hypothetical protein
VEDKGVSFIPLPERGESNLFVEKWRSGSGKSG